MKLQKLFVLPAVCCALALTLGAYGEEKQENAKAKAEANTEADAKAKAEAEEKAKLIFSEDGKTVTGVKDKGIKSVVIPNGVTSIGNRAFSGCSSLTSITIPDSVTGIGKNAFNRIKTVFYSPAFETLPDGTLINKKHKALVRVPENLSGGYTIPTGVTSIGAYAFFDCTSLTSITIPDSVTSIGDRAFEDCFSLTSITIPDSVTSIGDGAFRGVQSVQVSTKNPVFSVDGRGVLINKKEKKLLYAPPSLSGNYTIPSGVKSIGNSAFRGCKNLTSITIPDSVTSIGGLAFSRCTSLTSITIPSSVTSIGGLAFFRCSSLTSITISDSVTSIERDAFSCCTSLTSITIPSRFTDEDVKKWAVPVPSNCKVIRK